MPKTSLELENVEKHLNRKRPFLNLIGSGFEYSSQSALKMAKCHGTSHPPAKLTKTQYIEKLAKLYECEHCHYKVHTSWQPPTPQHFLHKKGHFHRLPAKKVEVPGTNSKESFSPSTRNRLGRLKNRKNCVKFTFITRCAATVASVECKGLLWTGIFQYHG